MTDPPKNLARPDESIRFPGITEDLVEVAGMTIARTVQEPGWRWSTDMQPLVGGEWCEARHIGLVLSGRLGALLRDGTVLEFGPDDVYDIPPGHDGHTVGDEPAVMIEWSGMRALAGSLGEFWRSSTRGASVHRSRRVDRDTQARGGRQLAGDSRGLRPSRAI